MCGFINSNKDSSLKHHLRKLSISLLVKILFRFPLQLSNLKRKKKEGKKERSGGLEGRQISCSQTLIDLPDI